MESKLEELKKVLSKTVDSIKMSDSSDRDSWISELEDLYQTELEQLGSAAE